MLRLLKTEWREDLTPEEKAEIQAANADLSRPLDTWGYRHYVQVGKPPHVALAWMDDCVYRVLQQCAAGMGFD